MTSVCQAMEIATTAENLTIEEIGAILARQEIEFEANDNRQAIFATAYLLITNQLVKQLQKNSYEKRTAVRDYLIQFATLYLTASNRYQNSLTSSAEFLPIAPAWKIAFDACQTRDASVIQLLMLGINAHMNHDLPLAIGKSKISTNCSKCYQDHCQVNADLASVLPQVRNRICKRYRPPLYWLNPYLGWTLDKTINLSFESVRESAWLRAIQLASAEKRARNSLENQIRMQSAEKARAILNQTTILGCVRAIV